MLMKKVWAAWHSVIEVKWRERVERACQARAEEVCLRLSADYERKIEEVSCSFLLYEHALIFLNFIFLINCLSDQHSCIFKPAQQCSLVVANEDWGVLCRLGLKLPKMCISVYLSWAFFFSKSKGNE